MPTRETFASARLLPRILAVAALFAGLLLMHGLPTGSCAATSMDASSMSHDVAAGGSMAATAGPISQHANACVANRAPRGLDLLLTLLGLAAAALLGLRARLDRVDAAPAHPPRTSGRHLLTTLSISRT